MANTLKDSLVDVSLVHLRLNENKSKSGNTVVRGEFASYGKPTANKRFYPEAVWKQEIKRLHEAMGDRRMFGHIDHPESGKTSLKKVSHIVTGMKLEDNILVGEAEILPTQEGKQLETLLRANCKVGVSSRGFGSVKSNDSGVDVVQEDYRLVTFDFVADPADSTAYPEAVFEGAEFPIEARILDENNREDSDVKLHAKEDEAMAKEWAKRLEAGDEANTEVVETEEVSKELPIKLLDKISEMRDELRDEIRGELLSDPKVAGAVTALESVKELLLPYVVPSDVKAVTEQKNTEIEALKNKLAEKDLTIKGLEEECEKLGTVAKEAAYKLYVERVLRDDPDAELIRNLIGEVCNFNSSAELKARLESVKEELVAKREEEQATKTALEAEAAKTQELISLVQEEASQKVASLEDALEKLATTNKELALRLYTEKRLRGNTKSAEIRSLIESTSVDSKEDVDEFIKQNSVSYPHDLDEAGDVRARVRKSLGSRTIEASTLQEESRKENDLLHGIPMREIQNLSGIKRGF